MLQSVPVFKDLGSNINQKFYFDGGNAKINIILKFITWN